MGHPTATQAPRPALHTYVVSMPKVSAVNHLVQMPHCSSISPSCRPFSSSTDPACVSMASGPSGAASCGQHSAGYRRQSPHPPPLCAPRTIGSFPLAVSVSTAAAAASPGAASPLQGHKRRLSAAHPRAAASQPRARPPPYPLSASAALGSGGAGGSAAGGSGAASALSPAGAAIAAAAAAAAAIAVDAPARVGPERRSREIPGFKGQCSRWDPRPDGSSAPYRRPAGRAGGDVTAVMRRHPARP